MNREEMLRKILSSLKKNYFYVSTFFGSNTCFDFIAKSGKKTLLIKVYDNIDSIRKEQGEELKKLANVLSGTCIIIGNKSKVFNLKEQTVYFRYNIPTLTLKTFEHVLDQEIPKMKYFKGKYIVDIDFEELKKKRKELNLSLEELAEKIGVASDTLHRFEKGSSTSLETAKKLETELNKDLVLDVDIFKYKPIIAEFDDQPQERLLEKVHDLGVKMAVFNHTPFRAYGTNDQGIFISTSKGNFDIPKKALELKKASAIIKSDSIIVTREYKYDSYDGVPILNETDLETISKLKDLKKLIEEREKID